MALRTVTAVSVAVAASLTAAPTAALQLLPDVEGRYIAIRDEPAASNPEQRAEPASPFAFFEEALLGPGAGGAYQTSEILAQGMSGDGGAETDGCACRQGASVFEVRFQVDEAAAYSLTGALYREGPGRIALLGPGGSLFETAQSEAFAANGTLQAGVDYWMLAEVSNPEPLIGYLSEWSFDLQLASVPEPTPGACLLLGLAVLTATRQQRR